MRRIVKPGREARPGRLGSILGEHAWVRCPMLGPEASRMPLLRKLEHKLAERSSEARERTWLGEVAGLEQTLTALRPRSSTPNCSPPSASLARRAPSASR
jgi:hypothetical protein